MNARNWKLILIHLPGSLIGFIRYSFSGNFLFAFKLLAVRCRYLVTRDFKSSISTPDGLLIESANELITYWSFFVEREGWADDWITILRRESSPLILDVGANAGIFTHWIWTLNRNATFIIFEPLPVMSSKIRDWIARTGAKATLHQAAVSDHLGEATFFMDSENDTGASLRKDCTRLNQLLVPLVTLDSVVPAKPVLLAKIDVEGCEPEALRGAVNTLKGTDYLMIEAHTGDALAAIRNILAESEWTYRRVGSSDYLFKRK